MNENALYLLASARADITPSHSSPLAGYATRRTPWNKIHSRLEANACLLSDGITTGLLISADLLYFGADITEVLRKHAVSRGISADSIVLAASHTHFAPATASEMVSLGIPDQSYFRFLSDALIGLIEQVAGAPRTSISLARSRIASKANINRRVRRRLPIFTRKGLRVRPGVVMAPAHEAPVDDAIDILQARDADGKLAAIFWKFACHPVSFPELLSVSSEFPGTVRETIRKEMGENVAVLFWQGFAGDVRPRLLGAQTWSRKLQAIRRGPSFGQVDMPTWKSWATDIARSVVASIHGSESSRLSGPLEFRATSVPLTSIIRGLRQSDARRSMEVQRMSVGSGFEALFFAAEVCSPWARLLARPEATVFCGYTGDVFGYLPTSVQIAEGGYEGGDFLKVFELEGQLKPDAQETILAAVTGLRQKPDLETTDLVQR